MKKGTILKRSAAKRFGTIAVEKGFVTPDQLETALRIQSQENRRLGRHRLIGQILVSLGFLNGSQVDEILETMGQKLVMTISIGR